MSLATKWATLPAILALLLSSCVTSSADLKLTSKDRGKHLSMDEVSGYPDKPRAQAFTKSGKKSEAPLPAIAPAPKLIADCKTLVARTVKAYRDLYAQLPAGSFQKSSSHASLDQMLAVTPKDCDASQSRRRGVEAIAAGVNQHSGKIGVILPLTGPRANYANYIVQGLRAALAGKQKKFEDLVVLKDSAGQTDLAQARLAELVFQDKVTLVVGGLDEGEAQALSQWSNKLMITVMLLARDRDVINASPYAYRVYPDEKRLAETLATSANKRGLKRFAIVKPDNHRSDKIAAYFKSAVEGFGGTVAYDLTFTPDKLDSMMSVGRQLFQIDAASRQEEFQLAYQKAREAAEREHVPFDPRMVVLRPIVQFDAVFMPEDFRTVRHFAKLFKFHMVDKLTLIGNHEWRSPALVEPWDPFLEGSFFADFIGSYAKLPGGLASETLASDYFVRPQQVAVSDFQLIGYRLGVAAQQALTQATSQPRQRVKAIVSALTDTGAGVFGGGKIFDEARQSLWPTYTFAVGNRGIQLEGSGDVAVSPKRLAPGL